MISTPPSRVHLMINILIFLLFAAPHFTLSQDKKELDNQRELWVSAYLASWNHFAPPTGNWGNLPTGQIDWNAFTHLFYFAFNAKPDGSLSEVAPYQNLSPDRIKAIVSAAHRAGKPVLFTVGGWGNRDEFMQAIAPDNRTRFISNLIQALENWKFDGIDLDLEPIKDEDLTHYRQFIEELSQTLDKIKTRQGQRPLLTVATNGQPDFFAKVHTYFNQINLMTYDFSGAWEGWVSWHNAPVYSSHNFPDSNKPLPSVDRSVREFVNAGVPPSKLGIGIDFYGYVWSGGSGTPTGGVTRPNQSWDHPPSVTDNVPYHEIMARYFEENTYHWDEEAKAAYLSIDKPGSKNDKFITYDDERVISSKFDYAKENDLGGVIIWELGAGFRQKMPTGQRNLLLKQVKNMIQD